MPTPPPPPPPPYKCKVVSDQPLLLQQTTGSLKRNYLAKWGCSMTLLFLTYIWAVDFSQTSIYWSSGSASRDPKCFRETLSSANKICTTTFEEIKFWQEEIEALAWSRNCTLGVFDVITDTHIMRVRLNIPKIRKISRNWCCHQYIVQFITTREIAVKSKILVTKLIPKIQLWRDAWPTISRCKKNCWKFWCTFHFKYFSQSEIINQGETENRKTALPQVNANWLTMQLHIGKMQSDLWKWCIPSSWSL